MNYAQTEPNAEEYLKRGNALLDQNDLDGAIRTYTTAIEIAPALVNAYIKRGIALRTNGDLNSAIDDFETVEKIDPNAPAKPNGLRKRSSIASEGLIQSRGFTIDLTRTLSIRLPSISIISKRKPFHSK